MRRLGAVPHSVWQIHVSCLLVLMAITVSKASTAQLLEKLRFTHPLYNGSIPENAVGKVYVTTPVKMGIYLPQHLSVQYSIVDGDHRGLFQAEGFLVEDFCFLRVRTKTGTVGRLNRERQEGYYLRVRAGVSVIPGTAVEIFTDLNITLLDQNEFSPLFPPTSYSVSIPEDTPVHSSIAEVSATDAEVGINGEIYYSLVDPSPMFAIHPTSGVVTLMRPLSSLDRKFKLDIHAEDRGLKSPDRPASPLSNTALVVSVTPVNYHPPAIVVQKIPSVLEDASPGSIFAVLTVTDEDEGANGQVASVSVVNSKTFRAVTTTRPMMFNVMLASRLDREEAPDGFNLTIMAVDRGQPPKTGSVVVPVQIQDVNDNAPAFEKGLYTVELLEVVPVNTPVLFVRAVDADDGQNGEVRYKLKSDDASNYFSIDEESGLISTAAELDAEVEKQILLVIHAEDRASSGIRLTGETKVIINVKDYNDNAPKFMRNNLENVLVNENMPRGTLVVSVTASDADSENNGRVSYSLHNTQPVPFEIDAFTGEITTTEVLDFETSRKQYTLIVRASDWGSPYKHWTQEPVVIRVQDKNDNSPEFEKTHCTGYLSREAGAGTEIVILTAIDFDAGNIISYSITEGNEDGCFAVEASTGAIQVSCDLTSYTGDSRTFTVVASDGEHLSVPAKVALQLVNNKRSHLSAAADVSVTCQDTDVARRLQEQLTESSRNNEDVQDLAQESASSVMVGEYLPEFDSNIPATITVPEDTAVGNVVLKVSVTDRDEGYAGQVLFVLSDGNEGGAFKIDTFSGNLEILSPLDYETRSDYNLTIKAQDIGNAEKAVSRVLRVSVSDENDNAPQFEHGIYEKIIFEDVQINTTVLQVFATDRDTDLNARLRYSLLTHGEDFSVESGSGLLKVKKSLDREKISEYTILVQAEDSGQRHQLSSTATVFITLNDVNDNFPEFVPKMQTVRVREDLPVGTVVTTLTAHDLDEGDNGRVTYKLVDGADNKFQVDSLTGVVRIKEKLDYETTQVYNLSVRAEDHGEQPLASMCLLNVEVVDVNENHFAPEFPEFLERGSVAENASVGTYVMSVRAEDKDEVGTGGGRITYSIRGGSGLGRFSIDRNGE